MVYALMEDSLGVGLDLYAGLATGVGPDMRQSMIRNRARQVSDVTKTIIYLAEHGTKTPGEMGRWLIAANKHLFWGDLRQEPLRVLWKGTRSGLKRHETVGRIIWVAETDLLLPDQEVPFRQIADGILDLA